MPSSVSSTRVDGCSRESAAVASANRRIDASSGMRTPMRSTRRPKNGVATATMMLEIAMALEISPRPKPRSCATGLRKVPAANTLIAPCPTMRATPDAIAIHHLLRRRPSLIVLSPDYARGEVEVETDLLRRREVEALE